MGRAAGFGRQPVGREVDGKLVEMGWFLGCVGWFLCLIWAAGSLASSPGSESALGLLFQAQARATCYRWKLVSSLGPPNGQRAPAPPGPSAQNSPCARVAHVGVACSEPHEGVIHRQVVTTGMQGARGRGASSGRELRTRGGGWAEGWRGRKGGRGSACVHFRRREVDSAARRGHLAAKEAWKTWRR